jgi:hypothetical protein
VSDVFSILLGLCLYFVLFLPTSYCICWLAGPFGFVRRSTLFRLCVAQAFSFAVTPYILFLFYRFATPWLILLPGAAGLALMVATLRCPRWRHAKPALVLLLVVTCLALALVTQWTIGTRTYLSVAAFDYAGRVSVTHALTADRVPPFNPSFAPKQPVLLFYYYFWFLSSSTVEIVSKGLVSARNAVVAGAIYNGMSLLATVVISAWLLFPGPRRRNRSRLYTALALLLVSGLDLLPFLITLVRRLAEGQLFLAGSIPGSLEWWNEQVTSWAATVLWVPHHTAAFVVLWLLYWESALGPEAPLGQHWRLILFRALALVSIFGMSVWLGLMAGAIFAVWTVQQMLHRNWNSVREWAATGLMAGFFVSPYIEDLVRAKTTSSSALALSVRRFFPVVALFGKLDQALNSAGLSAFAIKLVHQMVFLLCLPLNYAMELGVYFLGAILYWRFCRGTTYALRGGRAWGPLLLSCALVVTFVRSALANNDLGWRGFLPLQLALLLALVLVWDRLADGGLNRAWRPVLVALASVGLATTFCDLALMRLGPIASDLVRHPSPASRTFSRRQAYLRLKALDTAPFYVQHNPKRSVDYESALFGDRRVVLADVVYGRLYGVDPKTFQATFDRIVPVFESCGPGAEEYAFGVAADYHIRFWLFQNSDPIWKDRECWIWKRPAFFDDHQVLVIAAKKP